MLVGLQPGKGFIEAVKRNDRIAVFSDYDADGIPAAVVFHDFFGRIGFSNFEIYIPHRHDEGFGLNGEAVEELGSRGAKLLITVDCGIGDIEEVTKAKECGMETIIIDHHLPRPSRIAGLGPKQALPAAYAILNPKQEDCSYPEKMLCGSGVAFKFIQAILKKESFGLKEGIEKWLLDMVGIATLSDMVPLTGENRTLAHFGLKVLRRSPRLGLMKLLRKLNVEQSTLSEDDVGFTLSPRINAASRMGVPRDAFSLFTTTSFDEADRLADHLNKINDERKGTVAAMVKEIKGIVSERYAEKEAGVIVLGNPKWKPALLGLAANTLMNERLCPVFLWGRDGGEILRGSCRSPGDISLVEIMGAVPSGTFIEYGGHAKSGGFSLVTDKVHLLGSELERAYEAVRTKERKEEPEGIDDALSLEEVNHDTYSEIEKLSPFGFGNPKPLFLFEKIPVSSARLFGKEKGHVEFMFKKQNGAPVKAISFFAAGSDLAKIKEGNVISFVAHLEKSFWRGFGELRLRIVDLL